MLSEAKDLTLLIRAHEIIWVIKSTVVRFLAVCAPRNDDFMAGAQDRHLSFAV